MLPLVGVYTVTGLCFFVRFRAPSSSLVCRLIFGEQLPQPSGGVT
jgi:hypothetical protein